MAAFAIAAIIGGCGFVLCAPFYRVTDTSYFEAGIFRFSFSAAGSWRITFTGTIGLAFVIEQTFVTVIAVFAFIDGIVTDAIGAGTLIEASISFVFVAHDGV